MKKLSLFILIVLMLFAFVACNPNSSSSSASSGDETLPGEVTPPAESERKSMSEDDINKVAGIIRYESYKSEYTSVCRNTKIEVDFGESGTLSTKSNEDWKDSLKAGDIAETVTANGKIIIGSDSYVVDNLVLSGKAKKSTYVALYDFSIEKGSITKNGTAISAEDAFFFLESNQDKFYKDSQCISYSRVIKSETKGNLVDSNGKIVGSETLVGEYTKTKDNEIGIYVYDYTIGNSRIQAKIRETERKPSIDYVALDGVFFDKASCDKLLSLIYQG